MVWLFPVPGGPIRTKSLPFEAAITADSCEESDGNGQNTSRGLKSISRRRSSGNVMSDGKASRGVSRRCRTTGLSRSASAFSARSFHIKYLAKENMDRTTSSTTSQPAMSLTARPTAFQIASISRPESSRGSSVSSDPRFSSKSWRSISMSVGLNLGSSSCSTIEKPERALLRSSVTGIRTSGALYFSPPLSARSQLRKPSAR
ncbi:hypothetical protein D3C87_1602680 [compost metagenome]